MIDFLYGFLIELGLVMTVGLQSAFILKQGIRREFVIIAVLTCFLCETLLVTIGVAGMGALVKQIPYIYQVLTGIGIIFLVIYALKYFYSALKNSEYIVIDKNKYLGTKKEVLISGIGFALLNPHVILDTTIMGTFAASFYPHHWIFWTGVVTAAFVWYSFLGTVGSTLAKPLNKPITWRFINIFIGILCLYIAVQLTHSFTSNSHSHDEGINLLSIFGLDDSFLYNENGNHNHEHNFNIHNHNNDEINKEHLDNNTCDHNHENNKEHEDDHNR